MLNSDKTIPKLSLSRKRSVSINHRCAWIDSTFSKRECIKFVPSLYPLTVDPSHRKCGCGLLLCEHSLNVIHDFEVFCISNPNQWFLANDDPDFPSMNVAEINCPQRLSKNLKLPLVQEEGLGGINSNKNDSHSLKESKKAKFFQTKHTLSWCSSSNEENVPYSIWNPKINTSLSPTNAMGIIEFQGSSLRHKAQYIRLAYDTAPGDIVQLLVAHWGIDLPKLLISIHGGLTNFNLNPQLLNVFQRGLVKTASTTLAWIFTIGLNSGYVKYVGDALYDLPFKNRANVVTIGIVPWGMVQNRQDLIGHDKIVQYYSTMPYSPDTYPLNSHHSYFLLADDGTTGKYGAEAFLRRNLECYLMRYNIKHSNLVGPCCLNYRSFPLPPVSTESPLHSHVLESESNKYINNLISPIPDVYDITATAKLNKEDAMPREPAKFQIPAQNKRAVILTSNAVKKLTPIQTIESTHYYHTLPINTLRRRRHLANGGFQPPYLQLHRLNQKPLRNSHPLYKKSPKAKISFRKTSTTCKISTKTGENMPRELVYNSHPGQNNVEAKREMLRLNDPSSLHKKSFPSKLWTGKRPLLSTVSHQPHRHSFPKTGKEGANDSLGSKGNFISTNRKNHFGHYKSGSVDEIVPVVALFLNGGLELIKTALRYVYQATTITHSNVEQATHFSPPNFKKFKNNQQKRNKLNNQNAAPVSLYPTQTKSSTMDSLFSSVRYLVPIVIIDGSGGMSDLMCYSSNQNIDIADNEFSGATQRNLERMIHSNWSIDSTTLQILLSDLLLLAKNKRLITVYGKDSCSKSLDQEILSALLRIHGKRPLDQLHLALSWDRADVAKNEIFVYGQHWPEGALESVLMKALINDQVTFVKLLLENGINLKKFLSIHRLEKLYNSKCGQLNTLHYLILDIKKNIPHNYWYSLIDIGNVIDKLMGGVYRSSYGRRSFKHIYYQMKQSLQQRHVLDGFLKTSKSSSDKPSYLFPPKFTDHFEFPTNEPNGDNEKLNNSCDAFFHPFHDLLVWAILTQRHDMSLYFCEMGEEPLPKALMATKLFKSIGKEVAEDDLQTDISEKCFKYAKHYSTMSLELLDKCYKTKSDFTEQLLTYQLKHFSDQTCLSLAYAANHLEFISHSCCQYLLGDLWMGGLRVRKSSAFKIIIGLLFPCTILTLDFKTLAELQLMPQTLEEHINDLEQEESSSESENSADDDRFSYSDDGKVTPNDNIHSDTPKKNYLDDGDDEINFDKDIQNSMLNNLSPHTNLSPVKLLRKSFKNSFTSFMTKSPSKSSLQPTLPHQNLIDQLHLKRLNKNEYSSESFIGLDSPTSLLSNINPSAGIPLIKVTSPIERNLFSSKSATSRKIEQISRRESSPHHPLQQQSNSDNFVSSEVHDTTTIPISLAKIFEPVHSHPTSGNFLKNILSKSLLILKTPLRSNEEDAFDTGRIIDNSHLATVKHGSYYSQMLASHQSSITDAARNKVEGASVKIIDPVAARAQYLSELKNKSSGFHNFTDHFPRHFLPTFFTRNNKSLIPIIEKNLINDDNNNNTNLNAKMVRKSLTLPSPQDGQSVKKKRSSRNSVRRKSQGEMRKMSVMKKISQRVPKISPMKLNFRPSYRGSTMSGVSYPPSLSHSLILSSSTSRLNARTKFYEFYNAPITKFWCHTLAYFFFIFVFTHVVLVGNSAYILADSIYKFNKTEYSQEHPSATHDTPNTKHKLIYMNFSRGVKNPLDPSYPSVFRDSVILKSHTHVFASWTEIFVIAYIFSFACEKFREAVSNEAVGFHQKTKLWFKNVWNSLCLAGFILFCISLALKIAAAEGMHRFNFKSRRAYRNHVSWPIDLTLLNRVKEQLVWSRFFNALSAIFWYIRILDLLSCNKFFGPLVVMIGKMMMDMMIFVMIMVVIMASFGIARYTIRHPTSMPSFISVKEIFYQPYWMMYGEVFAADINPECGTSNSAACITGDWISPALMALYLLVTNILLVNLLIAVFNHTFLQVNAISQQIWKFGRFNLTIEYEMKPLFPPPLIIFCHIYRLYKYFQIRKKYGPRDIDANFDYGLKLYLSYEEVNKLHEFEKSCLEDLVYEKECKKQGTIDLKIEKAFDKIEGVSLMLDDLYNPRNRVLCDDNYHHLIEKRLSNLESRIQETLAAPSNFPLDERLNVHHEHQGLPPATPNTNLSLNRMFVMKYNNSSSIPSPKLRPKPDTLRRRKFNNINGIQSTPNVNLFPDHSSKYPPLPTNANSCLPSFSMECAVKSPDALKLSSNHIHVQNSQSSDNQALLESTSSLFFSDNDNNASILLANSDIVKSPPSLNHNNDIE